MLIVNNYEQYFMQHQSNMKIIFRIATAILKDKILLSYIEPIIW